MGPAIKLSTKSQASCCSVDRIVGRPLQGNFNRCATILSTLQQEAWDFANRLMADPTSQNTHICIVSMQDHA